MNIILLGKPGSGKGTQAEALEKKFFHISAGDLIREEIQKGTKKGKKYAKIINKGYLLPDEEVLKLVLKKIKGKRNILFDGYPRTVKQARLLEKSKIKISKVIYLDVPDNIIIKRLSNRLSCKCGAVYHKISNPPKKKNKCDICGSKLYVRDDDRPSVVKKRLYVYNKETRPLINYYKKKKILFKVNGDRDIKKIYQDIARILRK